MGKGRTGDSESFSEGGLERHVEVSCDIWKRRRGRIGFIYRDRKVVESFPKLIPAYRGMPSVSCADIVVPTVPKGICGVNTQTGSSRGSGSRSGYLAILDRLYKCARVAHAEPSMWFVCLSGKRMAEPSDNM